MTPTVQSLVDKAAKYDPMLAAEIREFAQSREYGLVFEHNRPERMRLYGKPVKPGDVVQVLPERGKAESADNKVCWTVESIDDDKAYLIMNGRGQADSEHRTASINDLVAVAEYQQPIYTGLKETGRIEHGDPAQSSQIVINGENYHALETLLFTYAGKIDCIYIDPPYNTGAKDWKYNNDYVDGSDTYRHSKWLAMMERRLKLAKQLLNAQDSVLIVTIDEKEYLRLGLLLEQVFPDANIQMITDIINPRAGVARPGAFSRVDEYIYTVRVGSCVASASPMNGENTEATAQRPAPIWFSLMRTGSNSSRSDRPNLFYPIWITAEGKLHSVGDPLSTDMDRSSVKPPEEGLIAVYPLRPDGRENTWQLGVESLKTAFNEGTARITKHANRYTVSYLRRAEKKRIEQGEIEILGKDDNGALVLQHKDKAVRNKAPRTVWQTSAHDAGLYGSSLLAALIENRKFPFPKSLYAVEDTLRFFVANKPNALILDFFSGSGTTAHAVMRLNHQDGGHRQCICVTNNEVSADEERKLSKAGYRHGDPEWEQLGICEYVTKPRIKAAITGRTPEGEPVKGDYKFTDEFPMSDGFSENAVFFDLEYLEPDMVELGLAFAQIAPLLWLRAGSEGRMIRDVNPAGFELADTYAVLFDYAYAQDFVEQLDAAGGRIRTVFIVTDDDHRYQMMCGRFPDRDVVRLYESYLQSFRIAAEGAEV